MNKRLLGSAILVSGLLLSGCGQAPKQAADSPSQTQESTKPELLPEFKSRLNIYHPVELTADISHLSDNQKKMLGVLIDASKIMDDLFWKQSYGKDYQALLDSIEDPATRKFADINYGPWDRLQGDEVFLAGFDEKPKGAQFYPADMTKDELNNSGVKDAKGLYSIIVRDSNGKLSSVPYSEHFNEELTRAAKLLQQAAELADNKEFANYLNMRAKALLTDDYQASDFAWMDMKTNPIELV